VRTSSGNLQTDRTFTGQKADGTGLLYYNARYYDPQLGTFLSPDTVVPDAGTVIDYNRFLYARGNPLRYNDPSGHCPWCITAAIGGVAGAVGNLTIQVAQNISSGQSFSDSIRNVNVKDVAIAGGAGAIAGALAPVTAGSFLATAAVNSIVGVGQYVASRTVAHGKSLNEMVQPKELTEIAFAGALGAAGGSIAGLLPDEAVSAYGLSYEVGAYAKAVGGKWFAKNTAKLLTQQQIVSMTNARLIVGATVGNAPAPCGSMEDCQSLVSQTILGKGDENRAKGNGDDLIRDK
jgi:RHS repeat-associated protein